MVRKRIVYGNLIFKVELIKFHTSIPVVFPQLNCLNYFYLTFISLFNIRLLSADSEVDTNSTI